MSYFSQLKDESEGTKSPKRFEEEAEPAIAHLKRVENIENAI
jgi:hypothetical protein